MFLALRHTKLEHCIHNRLSLVPILSHINPVIIFKANFSNIHVQSIFPSGPRIFSITILFPTYVSFPYFSLIPLIFQSYLNFSSAFFFHSFFIDLFLCCTISYSLHLPSFLSYLFSVFKYDTNTRI